MKFSIKNLFICAFALLMFVGNPFESNAQVIDESLEREWYTNRQKIKMISYNIWDGFHFKKDQDRIDRFVEWVKKEDPDVMSLQELVQFEEEDLRKIAARYGHPYVAMVPGDSHPVGFSSKYPIEVVDKRLAGYGHGLLHVKVEALGIDFLVTHLSPGKLEKRKMEAENIVAYIKEHNLTRCILSGDMNSLSPFDADWTDTDLLPYNVIATYMAANLTDVCYMFNSDEKRYTYPTRVKTASPKGEKLRKIQKRLDYIFVTPSLVKQCIEGTIYNNPENEFLSDHFPVGLTFFIDSDVPHNLDFLETEKNNKKNKKQN